MDENGKRDTGITRLDGFPVPHWLFSLIIIDEHNNLFFEQFLRAFTANG